MTEKTEELPKALNKHGELVGDQEAIRMFDGGSIENGLAAQFELKDVYSEIHCAHA